MVIHKLTKPKRSRFNFSKCGRAMHIVGGEGTTTWTDVTCKKCFNKYNKEVEDIMKSEEPKLIDKIEHTGRQTMRWLRVIVVISIIAFIFLFIVKPMFLSQKDITKNNENLERSLLLDKDCLINLGKEDCSKLGKELLFVSWNEFEYFGLFACDGDKVNINITEEQIESCSR